MGDDLDHRALMEELAEFSPLGNAHMANVKCVRIRACVRITRTLFSL